MPDTGRWKRPGFSLGSFLDSQRALLLLLGLFVLFSCLAPSFLSAGNILVILKAASLNGIVAIGFTIVFILGQLDLSIGSVVMLCGMLAVGLQPRLGWAGSSLVAILAGMGVGLVNGLLVVKARINSFIVTLGTMTVATGLMHLYSGGGSKAVADFRFADWLETPLVPFLPPIVIVTLLLVAGFACFLANTTVGRGFFVVGGNPETAWLGGLHRDRYLLAGFVICGTTAAIAGVLFAASLSSMTAAAVLGTRTLMTVLAAVIIGGALMTGGKGSVVKSYLAVLALTTFFNGIGCFGLGFEVQIFVNGVILAVVVLCEAYVIHRHNLLRGRRPDLLVEVGNAERAGTLDGGSDDEEEKEGEEMSTNDRMALACVTIAGIVGIVAAFAMFLIHIRTPVQVVTVGSPDVQVTPGLQPMSTAVPAEADVYALRGTDGQPYILAQTRAVSVPPRPNDPKGLPETERGHWWDIEYAGWRVEKAPMPSSPGDGPAGKSVVLLKAGDHPYWTAYVNGFRAVATAYGMKTKIFNSNWNMDLQAQQTDQALNERPDMIVFAPVDATACTPLLRRINRAGIPCITSNTIPCDEAMRYCLAWTGPDDWGQFRMLARTFADAVGRKGGYAIVRHMPGSSPFFARTYAPITELVEYAPDLELLAMDTANLEAEGTMQLAAAWLTKFGDRLKGLILAGDGFSMTGTLEAVRKAKRDDIVIVAAGNSKTGMDSVLNGDALAITYQSAEGDGAIAVHTAAEWFSGKALEPVRYLPKHIITQADVRAFMPAQW